ncbi:MAG: hypothetical protein ACREKS_14615 [Candidatus Rokuibacteriota bacterium]
MAREPHLVDTRRPDLAERNRRTARVLLAILAALAVATLLVGIRW